MFKLFLLAFLFLGASLNFSSQYESECITSLNGEPKKLAFFIQEAEVVLIQPNTDPYIWPLLLKDGSQRTEIKSGNFVINFLDQKHINGYLIKETVVLDTIIDFNYETKTEVVKVVKSEIKDTLSSCIFTKVK